MVPMVAQTTEPVHDLTAPLGPRLSDRAFQELLDTLFPRSPGKQKGLRRLRDAMDAQGCVTLDGGIRGWQQALDCGLSQGRPMLEAMAAEGAIALDIVREPGGWIANIVVLAAFESPDPCGITVEEEGPDPCRISAAPTREIVAPHQDALHDSPDRSGIKPPHTPHVESHESMQQQQHDCARARDAVPDKAFLTEYLLREFPNTDRALLAAWQANEYVDNVSAAYNALAGFPTATLRDWETDLAAARKRRGIDTAEGLVLYAWARGKRVNPPREAEAAPPPPRPSPLADRLRKRREEFDPAEARAQVARLGGSTNPPPNEPPPARASPPGPDRRLRQLWQAVLGRLEPHISLQELNSWLRPLALAALEAGEATVRAPSANAAMMARSYLEPLRRALSDEAGHPVQLRIEAATAAD